jgi:uroporphyrinogen decarboxylase
MSKFLDTFQGKKDGIPPLWFMRQAGRYLPEYREKRSHFKNFLEFCYTPDAVVEVTLQPIKRFDFDAAILFSDILVIPDALGQKVWFQEGEGPKLSPLSLPSWEKDLCLEKIPGKLNPVYEAIRSTKAALPPSKAFIGFSGAPWTLALYMLEGEGSRDFARAKEQAFRDEKAFSNLLDFLSEAALLHLREKIKAGVDVVQLFDTWAGLCPASHFEKWILEPTQKIVRGLKASFPELPIIGFPKGIGANLISYGESSGVSALSLDSSVPLEWACESLPPSLILQGNLDPLLLVSGGEPLKKACREIQETMGERPYIFNLGHGILPHTPISHVEECIRWVRGGK